MSLSKKEKDTVNIREEIEKYLLYWKWFVLGIFLSLLFAYLYIRYITPKYNVTTSIMIKDNQKSGISKEFEAFKDLGIIGGSSSNNPDNEIEILKSRKIIGNTIDTLDLNISYFVDGIVKRGELYGEKSPIKIIYTSKSPLFENTTTSSTVSIISKDKFQFKDDDENVLSSHSFGEKITSELGVYKIVKTKAFDIDKYTDVFAKLTKQSNIIDGYRSRVNIEPLSENSSVLIL
ncbi:MAG: Wzz/FepE/Etk N-terminal domain-containing protein, partial [Polaribacter sp.]